MTHKTILLVLLIFKQIFYIIRTDKNEPSPSESCIITCSRYIASYGESIQCDIQNCSDSIKESLKWNIKGKGIKLVNTKKEKNSIYIDFPPETTALMTWRFFNPKIDYLANKFKYITKTHSV